MYKISNKYESSRLIEKLDLNRLPEIITHKDNIEDMIDFMRKKPCTLYVIRNPDTPDAPYHYITNPEELPSKLMQWHGNVMLAQSVNAFRDDKVLLGTIEIQRDNMILLTATTNPGFDHRTIYEHAEFNIHASIHDRQQFVRIPEFDYVYEYLGTYELVDVIVEFTVYRIPIGIKHQRIVITEIRQY